MLLAADGWQAAVLHAVDGVCEREAALFTAGLLHAVDCFCKVEAGVRVSSSGRGREGEGDRKSVV